MTKYLADRIYANINKKIYIFFRLPNYLKIVFKIYYFNSYFVCMHIYLYMR